MEQNILLMVDCNLFLHTIVVEVEELVVHIRLPFHFRSFVVAVVRKIADHSWIAGKLRDMQIAVVAADNWTVAVVHRTVQELQAAVHKTAGHNFVVVEQDRMIAVAHTIVEVVSMTAVVAAHNFAVVLHNFLVGHNFESVFEPDFADHRSLPVALEPEGHRQETQEVEVAVEDCKELSYFHIQTLQLQVLLLSR